LSLKNRILKPYLYNSLNQELFPIENEKEAVFGDNGLCLYVKPDETGKYSPNERRILAILDDSKEKVIAAIVYGIASVPNTLSNVDLVDGVLGITYIMVRPDFRSLGLSSFLIKKAIEKSNQFIKKDKNIENPRVMTLAEQNNPGEMTFLEYITDFAGTLIKPMSRTVIWGKALKNRRVEDFNYEQPKLRKDITPCEILDLYVSIPNKETGTASISSNLLNYAVKSYAHLNLIKQQWDVECDESWKKMNKQIKSKDSFTLAECVQHIDVQKENKIWGALIQRSISERKDLEEIKISAILSEYEQTVEKLREPFT
jgi:hypothetical protein